MGFDKLSPNGFENLVTDTIYALSSGSPPAAVAVVRISGPGAAGALQALAGAIPEARRATLVTLAAKGEPLDRALVLRFASPRSATGEDVVELHLHGGRAVVAAVLEALAGLDGLRAAEPGEFTRRAFENGRIDLAEAEGLADLLAAETQSQRRAALALAGGALSRRVEAWRQRLLALAAALEAALDFSDEGEVGEAWPAGWRESLDALSGEMEALLARPPAERLKDGLRVVIAGPPNAGKSSLLNALAQRDAAITSAIPGTTRDLIEAPTAIGGMPFLLIDTAGLRDDSDEVGRIGVARARASLAAADMFPWLGDPQEAPQGPPTIVVHSKCDLSDSDQGAGLRVSSLTGEGLDELTAALAELGAELLPGDSEVTANARQREALRCALAYVSQAKGDDMIVAAEELRQARAELDRITGRAGVEDMLGALFGRFCIGK
jgi:tRNA modification GTPase